MKLYGITTWVGDTNKSYTKDSIREAIQEFNADDVDRRGTFVTTREVTLVDCPGITQGQDAFEIMKVHVSNDVILCDIETADTEHGRRIADFASLPGYKLVVNLAVSTYIPETFVHVSCKNPTLPIAVEHIVGATLRVYKSETFKDGTK
jgi:hypothetical protein